MLYRSRLIGFGSYLPKNIITNNDLSKKIDTSDEWIRARTGIRQRHIVSNETCTSMACCAAEQALRYANLSIHDIDAVIVATSTPDALFPTTAVMVQKELGMKKGFAFDVSSACSGFIFALSVADNFIKTGQAKNIILIGSEVYSRILDWLDRRTCVLFGDGAGAVILTAVKPQENNGILGIYLHTDGQYSELLYVEGSPTAQQQNCYVRMNGKEVFRQAVNKLSEVVDEALIKNNLKHKDIDWLVPHQANLRIINGMGKKLKLAPERVIVTVDKHANTSAASIPLALNVAIRDKRIKSGDLVIMETLGGGLSWGSALVRI